MIITYQGENYFKLQSGDDAVLVDPTDQRSFKGADLILNTLNPALVDEPDDEETFWIDHGGEYEVEGTRINGWSAGHGSYNKKDREKTIFRLDFKGFRFALFGFLSDEPDPEIIGELEDIDVAIIPADGNEMISASKAGKLLRQIEPSLIVPAPFGDIKPLLKEMNQKECEKDEKIVLKKKDLKAGQMKVHCLES